MESRWWLGGHTQWMLTNRVFCVVGLGVATPTAKKLAVVGDEDRARIHLNCRGRVLVEGKSVVRLSCGCCAGRIDNFAVHAA